MRWTASKTSLYLGGHRRAQDRVSGDGERDGRHFQGVLIGDMSWITRLMFTAIDAVWVIGLGDCSGSPNPGGSTSLNI